MTQLQTVSVETDAALPLSPLTPPAAESWDDYFNGLEGAMVNSGTLSELPGLPEFLGLDDPGVTDPR